MHEKQEPIRHYSKEEREAFVKEWKSQELNANQFSKQKNIARATFSSWIRKIYGTTCKDPAKKRTYKPRNPKNPNITPDEKQESIFTNIQIEPTVINNSSHIVDKYATNKIFNEIIIDNNIKLRLDQTTDPKIIVEIIKGLMK